MRAAALMLISSEVVLRSEQVELTLQEQLEEPDSEI